MKRLLTILCVLIVAVGIAYALSPIFDHKKIPPMALPDAYRIAMIALGSATNQFHCSGASFQLNPPQKDQWEFYFFNTNGIPKTILVCGDGSSRVYNDAPTY
jgi:hypothetical protein